MSRFFLRRPWGAIALCVCLCATLALSGCQMLRVRAASTNQLVLSTLSDPKTFNPVLNQEFPNIFLFTFRGLTREEGTTGEIQPELAESWEISGDRRQITFTLRDGLRWSDGQPLTAEDVRFTYEDVIFNDKIPTDSKDGLRIGNKQEFPTVEKLDDRRVRFTMPEPFFPFLRSTIGPPGGVSILPKHILQPTVTTLDSEDNPIFLSTWATNTDPSQIVSNGPYQVERYVPGERVIFRRNPYYWRRDGQGQPQPYIDRIVWQIVESTDTALLQFRSRGLDVMGDSRPLKPEYFSLLKREEDRGDFTLDVGGPWSGTTFMAFNLNQAINDQGNPLVSPTKAAWFNNANFRRAIAHAINRAAIISNVYRGISEPQNSPVSVQSPYYRTPEEGLPVYDYDLDQARTLLESAGFIYNANGELYDAQGNRVQFTLLTNAGNAVREAIGAQIKTDLAQIGIQVDFSPINFSTLVNKLTQSRDWDSILIGFTGGLDPHSGSNLWMSSGGSHLFNLGPQPGQPEIQNWQPTDWERQIDDLFRQGAQEFDEAKRREIYGEFQRIVQEQLPVIHLVHEIAIMAVRDRLQGVKYSGLSTWGLWNLHELKLEEQPETPPA